MKPLTFSPIQAARLLREARKTIEELTARLSACAPEDFPYAQIKLADAKKHLEMLERVPVRRKKMDLS